MCQQKLYIHMLHFENAIVLASGIQICYLTGYYGLISVV